MAKVHWLKRKIKNKKKQTTTKLKCCAFHWTNFTFDFFCLLTQHIVMNSYYIATYYTFNTPNSCQKRPKKQTSDRESRKIGMQKRGRKLFKLRLMSKKLACSATQPNTILLLDFFLLQVTLKYKGPRKYGLLRPFYNWLLLRSNLASTQKEVNLIHGLLAWGDNAAYMSLKTVSTDLVNPLYIHVQYTGALILQSHDDLGVCTFRDN